MGLIFIPKLTYKHLYFLAFSINSFLKDYISFINIKDYLKKDKEKPVQKRFFDIYTNVISDCLQGIFVLFHRLKVKKETSNAIENIDNSLFNRTTENKEVGKNQYFQIFIK